MSIRRSIAAAAAASAIIAGCATDGPAPVPGVGGGSGIANIDTGTMVGEVGDPRNRAKLHTELAAAYYSRGNMGVALEELRTAVEADPTYAPAHGIFGLVYMNLKENSLAEQSFGRALKLAPNDSDINHNYGWFLCQTNREQESIRYFLHAIRNPLYATPNRSYSAAGQCTMKTNNPNNLKSAEELFDRALKLDPDDSQALLQMGQIRYKQGNMEEARRLVARHNRATSPSAESLWLALRVERKLGERTAETGFATQLRRRFPSSPEYQALQRSDFD
jgi:type IV pilus assembly protein PilF